MFPSHCTHLLLHANTTIFYEYHFCWSLNFIIFLSFSVSCNFIEKNQKINIKDSELKKKEENLYLLSESRRWDFYLVRFTCKIRACCNDTRYVTHIIAQRRNDGRIATATIFILFAFFNCSSSDNMQLNLHSEIYYRLVCS